MKRWLAIANILLAAGCILTASESAGSVNVGGLADFVAKNSGELDFTNDTFKGFSNFHTSRVRVFLDTEISKKSFFFVQFMVDNYVVSLYGAYARFEDIVQNYVNIQLGFLPTTVGTFAARTYSNVNPLIGTPLLYNHHTSLIPSDGAPIGNIDNLVSLKDTRSNRGLPIIYDACWNSGVEIYGSSGRFNYSVGVLAGSVTKPLQEQLKNVPQLTTHLSYAFHPGLNAGISGYYGPYLFKGGFSDTLAAGQSLNDFINSGLGYEFYAARGYLDIYSEAFYSQWQYPGLPHLSAFGGYIEAKYKFIPGWHVAARYDIFQPDRVKTSDGRSTRWDHEIHRYELGVGYRFSRNILTKLVTQLNRLPAAGHLNSDLYALQISIDFR